MFGRVIKASLQHHWVMLAIAMLLVTYGGYRLDNAQYDVFPQFAPPQVAVQTEASGLAPHQVEQLITTPVENAMKGVPGIRSLRSDSILGLSVITATFDPDSDIYRDRQMVAERLVPISSQLPASAKSPVMMPLTSSTGKVLVVGMTSTTRSLMELNTVAQWTVRRRLLAVEGVANVVVTGGRIRQLQIQLKPQKLVQYGLSVEEVTAAAKRATGIRGAGFIVTDNQRIALQTQGQSITPETLANTILTTRHGVPITLRQVADVRVASQPPVGAALINGRVGVELSIFEQYGANTVRVTQRLEKALNELRETLKASHIQLTPDLFRPTTFIHRAIDHLRSTLVVSAFLVAVVLFFFLFNWRTALISLLAIPLSLLTATLVLELSGYTLNTMTIGGLAIAVGLLVDDAVITVENIYRRLRENQVIAQPRSVLRVIRDATLEVRSAVIYATLAIALVFIPVLTLPGVAGRLFGPLAYAYILATLASLAVALTVTPALSFVLLAQKGLKTHEPPLTQWLKPRYGQLLDHVERHYRLVIVAVVLLSVAGLAVVPFLGARFIPQLKEGHYIVHMTESAGTSLKQSERLGKIVAHALLQLPYIRSVAQKIGRSQESEDVLGANSSEFEVSLRTLNGAQSQAARREIEQTLAGIPGANFAVKTFLSERIEETVSGQTAAVVIHIFGRNLDTMNSNAKAIVQIVRKIPGASAVQLQVRPTSPRLIVKLKPAAMKQWGFHPLDVLDTLHTLYAGEVVGQVYDDDRIFDISVILPLKDRSSIAKVGSMLIKSTSGIYVPLNKLARLYVSSGAKTILHEGGRRVVTVTANVIDRDITTFVAQAKQAIAQNIHLPAGSYVEYAGTAQTQLQSTRHLIVSALIAAVSIALLLSLVLIWPRNLLLILLNVPFALMGGVLAVIVFLDGTLSMGGMVGFVTVFGITLRNSIMLIAHYEYLTRRVHLVWGIHTAIRGAKERVVPILMTALVTALGLLPLALTQQAPGNAIEGPMAIVILGGLATSTILNLLVMPALALRYGKFTDVSDKL